jgi:hypothetical protein
LSPKNKRVLVRIALLTMPVMAGPLIRLVHPVSPPHFRDSRSVYVWHDVWHDGRHGGKWTPLAPLPGGTEGIAISESGALWATTPSRKGINRWDGVRWVRYKGSDFGSVRDALPGGFAIKGDKVWAAAREGVARFDGQRWRMYPEAVKTRRAAATAAGPSGVWVIDESANLSHFDGEAWSVENLKKSPPGTDWDDRVEEDQPELRETADGAVWLLLGGLWRMDGAGWRHIKRDDINWFDATMIGQDGDRVWLNDDPHIFEVKPDGRDGQSFRSAGVAHKQGRGDLPSGRGRRENLARDGEGPVGFRRKKLAAPRHSAGDHPGDGSGGWRGRKRVGGGGEAAHFAD